MEEKNTVCISVERFEDLIIEEQNLKKYAKEIDSLSGRVYELEETLMEEQLNRYNLRYDECTNLQSAYCAFSNPLKLALVGITETRMCNYLVRVKARFDRENKVENAEDD